MTYAVIFTARPTEEGRSDDYHLTAERMRQLAKQQPGFIDIKSASEGDTEITISYWKSLQDVSNWKANTEHMQAQQKGREKWYSSYRVQVVNIEREYSYGYL